MQGITDKNGMDLVTRNHERLCIECKFCTDNDKPTSPAFLTCKKTVQAGYKGSITVCHITRWFTQGYYMEPFCGPDGTWFEPA